MIPAQLVSWLLTSERWQWLILIVALKSIIFLFPLHTWSIYIIQKAIGDVRLTSITCMHRYTPPKRQRLAFGQVMVRFKHPSIRCKQTITAHMPSGWIAEVLRIIKNGKTNGLISNRTIIIHPMRWQ